MNRSTTNVSYGPCAAARLRTLSAGAPYSPGAPSPGAAAQGIRHTHGGYRMASQYVPTLSGCRGVALGTCKP